MGMAAVPYLIAATAVASAANAGAQVYSANREAKSAAASLKQQERLAQENKQAAEATAEQERQEVRKQNMTTADTNAILQQAQDSSLSGGSTLLTSAQGVEDDSLQLGKGNRLLG